MHVLFAQVLGEKDLSRAGDLFSLDDKDIESDLSEILLRIREITDAPDYLTNANNQSVVEICITRVTSSIRETGSIEKHAPSLVKLLESCLKHNLKVSEREYSDPPHAKISSDIMSCIFLNYSRQSLMELALPVAVRFLYQGNKELTRNLSSYLSLAAIDNAPLIARHIQPILQSIIGGDNKALVRVLPQIYVAGESGDAAIHDHMSALVGLLPTCLPAEQASLLALCAAVARQKPKLLEKHIKDLTPFLSSSANSLTVLQTFVDMANSNPEPFLVHKPLLKQTADDQPMTLCLVARVLSAVAMVSKPHAVETMDYLVGELEVAGGAGDAHTLAVLLREVKTVGDAYPSLLPTYMGDVARHVAAAGPAGTSAGVRGLLRQLTDMASKNSSLLLPDKKTASSQTDGIVTVIQVGNPPETPPSRPDAFSLNSVGRMPIHKNASTSTREINFKQASSSMSLTRLPRGISSTSVVARPPSTIITATSRQPSATQPLCELSTATSHAVPHQIVRTTIAGSKAHHEGGGVGSQRPALTVSPPSEHLPQPQPVAQHQPTVPFNAIPFRDAVQQFCEKHLDKIKDFIGYVATRLPIPIKATCEESKSHRGGKHCKLHFLCFGRGEHCLYPASCFTLRTKQPRTWIHLMFLATQARASTASTTTAAPSATASAAVSQQDPAVGNLKACWDRLRSDSPANSFVRLVTSSFPSTRDQDVLIAELHQLRFFDVFEYHQKDRLWACFLCVHPERVPAGLLQAGGSERGPVIEGQLKEKKGRWKFLKRWKTRHFSLSGATITYSKKDKPEARTTLCISQIESVRQRGRRGGRSHIPKAFEIFTTDKTYVFKAPAARDAEQWVQALQIAVARTRPRAGSSGAGGITDYDVATWAVAPPALRQPRTPHTKL